MSDGEAALGQVGVQAAGRCAGPNRRPSNSGRDRSRRGRRASSSPHRCRNCRRHGRCARCVWKSLPSKLVMPAASWPRCCKRVQAKRDEAAASSVPQIPKMPHSSRSLSSSKGLVVSMLRANPRAFAPYSDGRRICRLSPVAKLKHGAAMRWLPSVLLLLRLARQRPPSRPPSACCIAGRGATDCVSPASAAA